MRCHLLCFVTACAALNATAADGYDEVGKVIQAISNVPFFGLFTNLPGLKEWKEHSLLVLQEEEKHLRETELKISQQEALYDSEATRKANEKALLRDDARKVKEQWEGFDNITKIIYMWEAQCTNDTIHQQRPVDPACTHAWSHLREQHPDWSEEEAIWHLQDICDIQKGMAESCIASHAILKQYFNRVPSRYFPSAAVARFSRQQLEIRLLAQMQLNVIEGLGSITTTLKELVVFLMHNVAWKDAANITNFTPSNASSAQFYGMMTKSRLQPLLEVIHGTKDTDSRRGLQDFLQAHHYDMPDIENPPWNLMPPHQEDYKDSEYSAEMSSITHVRTVTPKGFKTEGAKFWTPTMTVLPADPTWAKATNKWKTMCAKTEDVNKLIFYSNHKTPMVFCGNDRPDSVYQAPTPALKREATAAPAAIAAGSPTLAANAIGGV